MLAFHVNVSLSLCKCVCTLASMCACLNADRQPARVLICSHSDWSPKGRLYHLSVTEKGITAVLISDHKSHLEIEIEKGIREGEKAWNGVWRKAENHELSSRRDVVCVHKHGCSCFCFLRGKSCPPFSLCWLRQTDPLLGPVGEDNTQRWPFYLHDHPHVLYPHSPHCVSCLLQQLSPHLSDNTITHHSDSIQHWYTSTKWHSHKQLYT